MSLDRPRRAGFPTLVWRALRRRCPVCGVGRIFKSYTGMRERCPHCNLLLERGEGYFAGGMVFNLFASELVLVVAIGVLVWLTWPRPPWDALWIGSVVGMALFPVLFYPFSRAIWLAIDLTFRPNAVEEHLDPVPQPRR